MLIRLPKILLLDEITSALDKNTSLLIAHNIYDFANKYNISVIGISHKTEFDQYANKIITL